MAYYNRKLGRFFKSKTTSNRADAGINAYNKKKSKQFPTKRRNSFVVSKSSSNQVQLNGETYIRPPRGSGIVLKDTAGAGPQYIKNGEYYDTLKQAQKG